MNHREEYADYDSPWKEMLERYFPEFMAFFFPEAHQEIDWETEYLFLDKELQLNFFASHECH